MMADNNFHDDLARFFCHLFKQNVHDLNEHSSNTYDIAPSVVLVYNRNNGERTV
jgi:hypothetical protein